MKFSALNVDFEGIEERYTRNNMVSYQRCWHLANT